MSLINTVKSIQDIMRQDAGVDGDAQRIAQLVWMLFLRIFDSIEDEYEAFGTAYQSPIPAPLRWRNWAADAEGMTGDDLLDFVNNRLFPGLKDLKLEPGDDPRGFVVRDIFMDSYNYMKSGTLMRQVINKINTIDFHNSKDRHLFNDVYEKILRDLQSAGNAGEYYTPRPVTQFMAEMVDPQPGEIVLDPACGTAGFLICVLEILLRKIEKQLGQLPPEATDLSRALRGIEKKPLPHMLAMTNLILHKIEAPNIMRANGLTRYAYREITDAQRVHVVLTNPPFGGIEEPGIESSFPQAFQTKETADLFLVLIMRILLDGGRAGIVLPDGSLFGEGVKTRIKERLLETCNLHTIVRLPNGVFSPYTGINTNLLFFTKGEPTKEVWYFQHPLPPDRKQYSKTRPITIEEFDLEKAWWHNRVENEYAWRVSIDAIKARNYNLDIKNPNVVDPTHGDPVKLLLNYRAMQAEIATLRNSLRDELAAALERGEARALHRPDDVG